MRLLTADLPGTNECHYRGRRYGRGEEQR